MGMTSINLLAWARIPGPDEDIPKIPPPPAKEPEPDVPDTDDELGDLVRPVKT
jgi:hypothetical protein